ncbi:MAG: hypothetical protein RMK94_16420, partial [Armatimonadota bacterium]|nr:hypothetical protein [Armatimonadota bacterium]
ILASGSSDRTVKLWRVSDGSEIRTLSGHTGGVLSVSFSPDGQILASGSWDGTVKLWRVSDGSEIRTLSGHTGGVLSVSLSPDGQFLASGSWDGTVKLWRVSDGSEIMTLGHPHYVNSVSFSPDGQILASASWDGIIRLWRISDGSLIRTLTGHGNQEVNSVSFSPDGQFLASGSSDGTVKLWRVSDGSEIRTLSGHTGWVLSVSFSPDGQILASGDDWWTIKLWRVSDGSLIRTLMPEDVSLLGAVNSISFSPDGQILASGTWGGQNPIKLWRVSDGSLIRTLSSPDQTAYSVSFSVDGQVLASAHYETINLWRVSEGSLIATLRGHESYVYSVSFSPNGQFLASGGYDGTIKLWRVSDRSEIRTLAPDSGGGMVLSVSFSPDGRFLASSGGKGVILWRVEGIDNQPPLIPNLLSPENNSTITTLPFQLSLSSTDPNMQRLKFKVELLRNGEVVQTFDQTRDTSGWDKAFYASGETAILTISNLAPGSYQWRAYAFDGIEWSSVSETRNFTFVPQIQWTMQEPLGEIVQFPVFRMKATIPNLPSTERLQYRVEVSSNPNFSSNVLVFDQSIDSKFWSKERYASDEVASFVCYHSFPRNTTLYWRARVKRVGESNWSEPSPTASFAVIRGFSVVMPPFFRVGRINRILVQITNPHPSPTEFFLSFELSVNIASAGGQARLIDPNGNVVLDQVEVSTEGGILQYITPPLPQGTHTFVIEFQSGLPRIEKGRLAPFLALGVAIATGIVVGMVIEETCKQVAQLFLEREHNLSQDDADSVSGIIKDVFLESLLQGLEKAVVSQGAREALGRTLGAELAEKLFRSAGKGIPFVGWAFDLWDCWSGIQDAIGGSFDFRISWDPNMKIGVVGREGYIQAGEPLPYQVLFENIVPPPPMLPAPAQEVFITDVLDEDIDLSSFVFTGAGFGDRVLTVPPNTKVLSLDVDLGEVDGQRLVVQIRGHLDEATRTVRVSFRGIDPTTGELHPTGFLPVNENPPEGEGFVAFEVRMKEDIQSGTEIRNKASIVFDVNDPIETNEVVVIVDRVAPQSRVTNISGAGSREGRKGSLVSNDGRCVDCGVQNQGNIEVEFEANDDVSGVDVAELWVSEERVNFRGSRQVIIGDREYQRHSTISVSATPKFSFRGKFGYNYRFYTVARDVAGNREPEPDDSDARITIGQPPTLQPGLHMVSVPVESEDADPRQAFLFEGNKWARWNPEARNGQGEYVLYDNDPNGFTRFSEPDKVPGRGYWVRIPQQTIVQVYGNLPDERRPFAIPLKRGWNQIGNPWLVDLIWDLEAIQVQVGNETRPL